MKKAFLNAVKAKMEIAWNEAQQSNSAVGQESLAYSKNNQISQDNVLNKYSQNKLNDIASRGEYVATTKEEIKKYVSEAFADKSSQKDIHIGVVSQETINKIREKVTGISKNDIANLFDLSKEYDVAINQDAIRHIKKNSMTIDDVVNTIMKLDDIIVNFDSVQRTMYEKKNQKNNALVFKKSFEDGTYSAVELLYTKRKLLNTQTMYMDKIDFAAKQKKSNKLLPVNNNSRGYTPETRSSSTSYDTNDTIKLPKSQNTVSSTNNTQNN